MAYAEWCADSDAASSDVSAWRQANPPLGYWPTLEFTASEVEAMSDEGFRRERLGIWCEEVFALDVSPHKKTAVAAAGFRADGSVHVEVV